MGFLFTLLNRNKIKRYDHIVSLGYNCEIAYQLFKHNGFLESNLFAWTLIPSLETLISVLTNLNQIGSEDYESNGIMYICNKTKICFHGKTDLKKFGNDPERVRKDKEELRPRVVFLREKFISVAQENSRKLYILKVRSSETDVEQKIDEIRGLLDRRNNGFFDLLFVPEETFLKTLSLTETDGFHIRPVSEYAPDDAVTSKHHSFKEWQRIFDEFVPLHKLKKTKKYKFEEVEQ